MFVEGYAPGSPSGPAAAMPAISAPAPTEAAAHHAALLAAAVPTDDADHVFDLHVLACLLAVAIEESARERTALSAALGLSGVAIAELLAAWFPTFDRANLALGDEAPAPEMEEELLRDLLKGYAIGAGQGPSPADLRAVLAEILPTAIARRALRPDHLWQDLGLADRGELNRLLARHFPALYAGNAANMRWKKYFYRKLCEAEGFSLCTAPSCSVCADFASCFGAEDGESRMAAARRAVDRAAHPGI